MKCKLFILLFFFTAISFTQAQSLAYIDKVFHIGCDGKLGYIEMGLLSDDIYEYYFEWEDNGQTIRQSTLILDDLPLGTYTFYIEDVFGCAEEFVIPILAVRNITATSNVVENLNRCLRFIDIIVHNQDGEVIPSEHLIFEWSNPSLIGANLILDGNAFEGCVNIYLKNPDGTNCATAIKCFDLPILSCVVDDGDIKRKHIIVNEFNRSTTKNAQFVELLVVGNGVCGENMDVRGYHIDDNNGMLIPPNDMVTSFNTHFLGIDPGAIYFSHDSNWSSVDNGSLILIYDAQGLYAGELTDDPTDSNNDGVYILASDSPYLLAKETPWNPMTKRAEYDGTLIENKWELIQLSSTSDGMQVRDPDGVYVHGLSLGTNSYGTNTNNYELWITENNANDCNCYFTNLDPYDKTHFNCVESSEGMQTPGAANSTDNQDLINSLRDCSSPQIMPKMIAEDEVNKNLLHAYPNPFTDIINIDIASNQQGKAQLELFTSLGQIIKRQTVDCSETNAVVSLDMNTVSASVIYVRVKFPDGETQITRVIKVKE